MLIKAYIPTVLHIVLFYIFMLRYTKKTFEHMLKKFNLTLLFSLLFFQQTLLAEEQGHEYMFEVNPQWYSYAHYVIDGPIGVLKSFDVYEKERYYAKPAILFSLTPEIAIRFGGILNYTNFHDFENRVETSPYVGMNYFHTFSDHFDKFSISSYFRAEKRYFHFSDDKENEDMTRLRLRLRGIYQLNSRAKTHSWYRAILGAEILRTYNDDLDYIGIEENFKVESRLSLALDRTLDKDQRIRFEATWKYQVPLNQINDVNVNTIRFKIRYYPTWGNLFDIHLLNAGGE